MANELTQFLVKSVYIDVKGSVQLGGSCALVLGRDGVFDSGDWRDR